ncbi:MAG: bifunctional tetrahydrofolate synthase/dihydrofolate synthase, partial [bacterium]|nr:bifunctional tetrahydrofolate synthase/dihydrofolate synthase [bacterium]
MDKPSNNWNLSQWVHYLENRTTQEIQLGLTRIQEVAHRLNVHLPRCKVISVAGTNGKGSTVAALETIYHKAGFTVGAYTSPHLMKFNERIRINLSPISDELICDAFELINAVSRQIILTFFEMTTLAALVCFQKYDLDIII